MRSIFAKVVLWSLGTFVLSLVAYWLISRALDRRGPREGDPMHRLIELVQDDARRAYEEGGPERLASYLKRLPRYLPGEHLLTDAAGRDLVSGDDRSDLLRSWQAHSEPRHLPQGCFIHVAPPRDPRYRFISIVHHWFNRPNIFPYYGAIVLVITGMGSILAAHLAAPLRRLRQVVDRFGEGDLTSRVHSARKDEIGEVSRAFDEMAGRIETLLAAERRLLQDVSHELRSPLTRLDVAVDLALSSEDRGESLGRIKRDIGRLTVLVNELLELTRAEGDPSVRAFEPMHLDDLLGVLFEDCEVEAEAKGCRVVLHNQHSTVVEGDWELLRRAIENVVRNAIRHTPNGTSVEVRLEQREDLASVTVRDYGAGVPDDALTAIFDPFFRVEGHRSRASGGVGLGLAIARRAVEIHGGRIFARNASPGLIVTVELPARTSEEIA